MKKYFTRSNLKKIRLGSLPCRFIKIVVTKGVYLNPKYINLVGFASEDAANLFGEDAFSLLVVYPQRLMYY